MDISETGLNLIESFEGYSFKAYWDPWGKIWTVGYGETEGVNQNTTQTRAQAEADLHSRLQREYEPAINALGVQLNQNQYDALCSFIWNLGPGSMTWDVGRYVRARQFTAAANAMLNYDHAGGVVLAGLVRRRQEERALFLKAPAPPPDPHHYQWYTGASFSFGAAHISVQGKTYTAGPRRICERLAVEQYDRLRPHPQQNALTLNKLRIDIMQCRDRVWDVAHWTNPTAWNDNRHLGFRWGELDKRMKGQLVAS